MYLRGLRTRSSRRLDLGDLSRVGISDRLPETQRIRTMLEFHYLLGNWISPINYSIRKESKERAARYEGSEFSSVKNLNGCARASLERRSSVLRGKTKSLLHPSLFKKIHLSVHSLLSPPLLSYSLEILFRANFSFANGLPTKGRKRSRLTKAEFRCNNVCSN